LLAPQRTRSQSKRYRRSNSNQAINQQADTQVRAKELKAGGDGKRRLLFFFSGVDGSGNLRRSYMVHTTCHVGSFSLFCTYYGLFEHLLRGRCTNGSFTPFSSQMHANSFPPLSPLFIY